MKKYCKKQKNKLNLLGDPMQKHLDFKAFKKLSQAIKMFHYRMAFKTHFNKLIFLYNKSQAIYRFIMLKFRTSNFLFYLEIPYRTNLPLNQTNQLL